MFVALLDGPKKSCAVIAEEEVVLEEEVEAEVAQVGRPADGALVDGGDVEARAHVGDPRNVDGSAAAASVIVLLIRCLKVVPEHEKTHLATRNSNPANYGKILL